MSDTLMTDAPNTNSGDASQGEVTPQGNAPAGEATPPQQQSNATTTTGEAGGQPSSDAGEGKDAGDQTAKPTGAPEKYEFEAPDGLVVDESALSAFSEVAKELDMSQEAAQKVLSKMAPAMAQRQAEALEQARETWAEGSRTDKEFGGDKLQENLSIAKKAMDQFGTPELRTLLNESGLGNHPEIVRAFYRAGKAISEDSFVAAGNGNPTGKKDLANSLYPNQKS